MLFSFSIVAGISVFFYLIEGVIFKADFQDIVIYGIVPTIGFVACFSLCTSILKRYQRESEGLINSSLNKVYLSLRSYKTRKTS